MEDQHVHQYLQLFTTSDKFYLKPSQLCCSSEQVLVINRQSGEATVKNIDLVSILGPEKDFKLIFGFLGSIKLLSGLYLVVVTNRLLVGKIHGQAIFQVDSTEIIPYARSISHLTPRQVEDNERYERMVQSILALPGAYFCCSHDLTRNLQDIHRDGHSLQQVASRSLLKRADRRFVWNRHLLKDFASDQFGRFTLPLIQGFVSINHVVVNGHKFTWSLISRRSVDRTGTRLFVRGIDAEGNVANHVVTEQIIETADKVASFVLTRGSIPLPWTQYPDLTMIPTPNIGKKNHTGPFLKHFKDQESRYGKIVCINLISQRGKEGALEEAFRTAVNNMAQRAEPSLPTPKYRLFDFHKECRTLRYDKLDALTNSVSEELKGFGYFLLQGSEVVKHQSGTFRVNCIDCLDRTNVVQSVLAKVQLQAALEEFGITNSDDERNDFDCLVDNVWAEHADTVSMQYCGAGALKTDFTRTGQRTYSGIIADVPRMITRYYMSNFADGFKQDALDVFLGNYTVPDGKYNKLPSPLNARHDWKFYTVPSVFAVAVLLFCASLILPASYSVEILLCLMCCAYVAAFTISYIFRNSREFVDWPKLRVRSISLRLHQH